MSDLQSDAEVSAPQNDEDDHISDDGAGGLFGSGSEEEGSG